MASIMIADREWDLVGPNVDEDVRRIISRYGADNVQQAVAKQIKKKPGRKLDNDQVALRGVLDDDAAIWLEGKDPFSSKSNYEITKIYCNQVKGNSVESKKRRLMRKLGTHRHEWVFLRAAFLSKNGHPHRLHLRALKSLIEASSDPLWAALLESANTAICEYEAKFGEAPPDDFDICEVREAAARTLRGIGLLGPSGMAATLFP